MLPELIGANHLFAFLNVCEFAPGFSSRLLDTACPAASDVASYSFIYR